MTRRSARAEPILRALADRYGGLTTAELAAAFPEEEQSSRLPVLCYQAMLKQEGRGCVRRAGYEAGRRGRTIRWQITEAGRRQIGVTGPRRLPTRREQVSAYFRLLIKLAETAEGERLEDLCDRIERTIALMAKLEEAGT